MDDSYGIEKRNILNKISKSTVTDINVFSKYTPEYLIEEKVTDEDTRVKELKEAKDKPLFELFNIKFGTTFPTDPSFFPNVKSGKYCAPNQLEECREYLRELLELDDNNTPDLNTFTNLSFKSENEITQNKKVYHATVIKELDRQWIENNMDKTFGDFLTARRNRGDAMLTADPTLEPAGTVASALNALKTPPTTGETSQPDISPEELHMGFGKGLIGTLSEMKLSDIKAKREEIRKKYTDSKLRKTIKTIFSVKKTDSSKTKWMKRALQISTIIGTLWAGSWGIGHLFSNGEKQEDKSSDKAPTEERTQAVKTPPKAPAPAVKTPAPVVNRDNTQADEPAPTSMVKKALDNADTKKTNSQESAKPTAVIGKKGNHLIATRWAGYYDIDYDREMKEAPELLLKANFDHMKGEIQEKGLPFADLFRPEHIRRAIKSVNNRVWLKAAEGKEKIRFYIRPNGRTRDAIMEDVLGYLMNCQDVLQSLPVPAEKLPMVQTQVMTALDYQMGYSAKEQIAWQRMHPSEAKHAAAAIEKTAREAIQRNNVDTNNMEAVFMETVEATRIYQEAHPENKALLLTLDEVTRNIANIERENMAQYNRLDTQAQAEVKKHIVGLHQDEEAEKIEERQRQNASTRSNIDPSSVANYPTNSSNSDDSSSGFPWKTTLLIAGGAYLWGKRKGKKSR